MDDEFISGVGVGVRAAAELRRVRVLGVGSGLMISVLTRGFRRSRFGGRIGVDTEGFLGDGSAAAGVGSTGVPDVDGSDATEAAEDTRCGVPCFVI